VTGVPGPFTLSVIYMTTEATPSLSGQSPPVNRYARAFRPRRPSRWSGTVVDPLSGVACSDLADVDGTCGFPPNRALTG